MERNLIARSPTLKEQPVVTENVSRLRLFGRTFTFQYHDVLIPFTLLLRVAMAWVFLWAGIEKLLEGFSAAGFLVNGTSGPLKDFWVSLGQSSTAVAIINPLVIVSQILIGVALLLGLFTRLAFLGAAAQMFLFYLAQYPPEFNPFLDYFIVYILVFALLGALGAGRILGLDRYIERWPWVRRSRWPRYLLG